MKMLLLPAASQSCVRVASPHCSSPASQELNKSPQAFLPHFAPALWADLEAWAQEELRSVNGQIEMILRRAIQKRKGATQDSEDQ